MSETISRFSGTRSGDIIVGSQPGVDVSVLRIDNGRVMVVSCDPVSFIPSIGPKASATMSVYEVASDVATSGIPPKYAVIDLNLPPHLSDGVLKQYWRSFHEACLGIGLSIVGGHTGRFEGCDFSVIGGATLWTFCGDQDYVTSSMAEDGDDLLATKSAAFGATSVLTRVFPKTVRRVLGDVAFAEAWKYFPESNTVRDALTAARVGIHERGVTGMHDATEGGVLAAIHEIASASRLGALIDLDQIRVTEETLQLCRFFGIDPLTSLGEGCLVIAAKPHRTHRIMNRLKSNGINATVVGRFSSKTKGVFSTTKGRRKRVRYPSVDPYWQAYWKGVRRGWA